MKPLALLAFLLTSLTMAPSLAANTRSKNTNPSNPPKNAVLLSSTKALTLHSSRKTTARRGSAIPQLTCSGPREICALYTIDTLRCVNEGPGYSEQDVQWSCRADLPEEFKLGSTEVSCEGYESSEDPWVLKGSCGVEYRLLLTEKGEEKYGKGGRGSIWGGGGDGGSWFGGNSGMNSKVPGSEAWGEKESNVPGTIFMLIFVVVAGVILFNLAKACFGEEARERRRRAPRRPRGSGGTGGGGFDDGTDNDPPPPYDYHSPPTKKSTTTPRTYNRSAGSSTRTAQDSWRPGFWSGAAAGAAGAGAGAYYANRRSQEGRTQPSPPETRQTGGGGWFGGGGSSGGGRSGGSSSSTSSPSYSSTRYESTGFGGTSRR